MPLSPWTRSWFWIVLATLAANWGLLVAADRARVEWDDAQQQREQTLELIDALNLETELLAQLAQSIVQSGSGRQQRLYEDILAVRDGSAAPPVAHDLALYWRAQALGQAPVNPPSHLPRRALLDRMRALQFSEDELAASRVALILAQRLQLRERAAFDAARGQPPQPPNVELAMRLLQSPEHEQDRAKLARALDQLVTMARARSENRLVAARQRVERYLDGALALQLAALILASLGALAPRRPGQGPSESIPVEPPPAEPSPRNPPEPAPAQSRLLAALSHDIRTPVNSLMGMLQLTQQTALNAEQRDYLTKAQAAARLLLGQINDLHDYAKLDAGRLRIDREPLILESVVSQVIELVRAAHTLQPGTPRMPVELMVEWSDARLLAERGQLLGDPLRLQQIMVHLLSNALKYTPSGQVLLRLDSEAGAVPAEGLELRVSVHDTGIGMSPERLAALFSEDPLAGPGLSGGSGLGMALTRRLVTLMGGRLEAFSHLGLGSRFEISLPMQRSAQAQAAPRCPDELQSARVLVTEERPETRKLLLSVLATLGIGRHGELLDAESAAQALERLRSASAAGRPVDWLLLDWLLPDARGPELLAELRREHPQLRVVVISSFGHEELRRQARGLGACDFLVKPVQPADIRRAMFESGITSPVTPAEQSLTGLRALLVEDHAVNREIAQRLLGSRGARVELACNGQEALDHLVAQGPDAYDVVLMDLEMPVLDGLEATRRLRAMPGFERLPVLAMTAHVLPGERERCLAAGMQGHIAKPLDLPLLVRELQGLRRTSADVDPPRPGLAGPPSERWPRIPGIDHVRGLVFFDQQLPLYRRSLAAFAEQYDGGLETWANWITQGSWPELRRAAHTLQGLAATMGAQGLHDEVLQLELAAARQDDARARSLLPDVAHALARLVADIHTALDSLPGWMTVPSAPQRAPSASPGSSDDQALLERLSQWLHQSDSQALACWQEHQRRFMRLMPLEAWQQMDRALKAVDFDAALRTLQASVRRTDP